MKTSTVLICTIFIGVTCIGTGEALRKSKHNKIRSKRFISTEDAVNIVATVIDLWELVDKKLASNEINLGNISKLGNLSLDISFLNRKQAQLTNSIRQISKQLDRIEDSMNFNVEYTINTILTAMPQILRHELKLHDLKDVIKQINLQDNELQRYLANQSAIERHTLEDWALTVSSHHRDSIRNLMARLHEDVMPSAVDQYSKSIFRVIQQSENKQNLCQLQQSQQQVIYQIYNMIAIAELKGYTMLQFAWMLLKIYDKGNFTTEAQLMKNLYLERASQKGAIAKEAMESADRSMYRCDAEKWVEGENYVRITKLLQGYIENEVNLNPDGTCGQNCQYYGVTEYYGCFKEQFCSKQRPCHGKILQCSYYDSDMNICQAPPDSDRRYDWIEYENGVTLGSKGTCSSRFNHKVDSWWRYLFWHCSYCFCLCDDTHISSDRYFSLRQVSSDIDKNMIITGARLVKDNQIIHIQIQQGVLKGKGVVDKSTIEWVPVQSFSVMDGNVQNGVDYHTLTHRARDIDLDDAFATNSNYVLTGAHFRLVGSHLNLEIVATPFDFATGKLRSSTESIREANDNTDGSFVSPRREVILLDPDIPTRHSPHQRFSKHDEYLKFHESSLKKDASQSTVPYIDSQPLESKGLPLSGLGMYHRGTVQSGGFLALKLITYDFTPHINTEPPIILK